MENLHAVSQFNTKQLVLWTTPKSFRTTVKESLKRTTSSKWATLTKSRIVRRFKYFHAFVYALNYVSLIGANGDWINQLNSKNNDSVFLFRKLYFGIDNVCRLLQWIARIKNGLKLRPVRYRTYSNQISTRLIRSDNESAEEGDFEVVYDRTCTTMSER